MVHGKAAAVDGAELVAALLVKFDDVPQRLHRGVFRVGVVHEQHDVRPAFLATVRNNIT